MIHCRKFSIDVYRVDVRVVVCQYDELGGWLDRRYGKGFAALGRQQSNGKTWWFDTMSEFVIWFPDDEQPTVNTVVHESAHVALTLLHSHGVIFSLKSEEAFTYAIDYVAGKVFEAAWSIENRLRRDRKGGRHRKGHTTQNRKAKRDRASQKSA